MKTCRFCALSLLGWYLLIPPVTNHQIDTEAPFNIWEQFSSYDTADECELQKEKLFIADTSMATSGSRAQRTRLEGRAAQLDDARCISADDPRLGK